MRRFSSLFLSTLICLSAGPLAFANADDDNFAASFIVRGERSAAVGDWSDAASFLGQAAQSPVWRQRALYDLGVADYHLGAIPLAIAAEREAIQLNPKFVAAHIQLATILARTGDYVGAEAHLKRAIQIDPKSKIARANLNQLRLAYLNSAKIAAAKPVAKAPQSATKTVVGQSKAQAVVRVASAAITYETAQSQAEVASVGSKDMGKLVIAAAGPIEHVSDHQSISQSQAVASDDVQSGKSKLATYPIEHVSNHQTLTQVRAATIAYENSHAPNMVASGIALDHEHYLDRSAQNDDNSVAAKPDMLAISHESDHKAPAPKPAAPVIAHAESSSKLTQNRHAETVVAAKLDPQYAAQVKTKTAGLIAQSIDQFNKGELEYAKYSLKHAINLDPSNATAHQDLAVVLGTQGDVAGEIEQLTLALQSQPNNAVAHFNLGWALAESGKWLGSFEHYDAALRLDEKMVCAIGGMAVAQAHLGKTDEALAALMQAKIHYATKAWPCIALSKVYVEKSATKEALAQAKEALAREANDVEAQKWLARLDVANNGPRVAARELAGALAATPYDYEGYMELAAVQSLNKDRESALSSLKTASKIAPASAAAHAALCGVLEELGRSAEADDEGRAALTFNPHNK